MQHSDAVVIGVAFWLFLTVASVDGVVADFEKRRMELGPLRAAIGRGQQPDPASVGTVKSHDGRGAEHLRGLLESYGTDRGESHDG